MDARTTLKPIGPALTPMIGQVYDYIGKPATNKRRYILSARRWYLVRVRSRREFDIEEQIEELRIAAYVPRKEANEEIRPHVHKLVTRALFKGYVFAGFDVNNDPWPRIREIPYVIELLSIGDELICVSDMAMLRVRDREIEEADRTVDPVVMKATLGDTVRIVDYGSWTGLFSIVTELDPLGRRVRVEVDLMRRKVPLWLPEDNVEVI